MYLSASADLAVNAKFACVKFLFPGNLYFQRCVPYNRYTPHISANRLNTSAFYPNRPEIFFNHLIFTYEKIKNEFGVHYGINAITGDLCNKL